MSTFQPHHEKGVPFEWDETCRNTFRSIKSYLMKPPVLIAPVPRRPLILYIAVQESSVGALLAQENDEGKESALYYLSRRMTPNELKYSPIEKICLALIFAIQKLKHYFQAHTVRLVSKANPLKYVMSKLVLSDRLARCYAQRLIGWLGDVEIEHVPRKDNKQADALTKLASTLMTFEDNSRVPICKSWVIPPIFDDDDCEEEEELHAIEVFDIEKQDWRQPLIDYLKYEKVPDDPRRKVGIRRRATRFIHHNDTLYRRSFDGVFLRCLSDDEAIQAMEEAHSGVCSAHQSGPKLHFRIKRMGYYWPTMVKDCINYAQRCQACQFHANFIHQPPEPLHLTVALWPFDAWGLDVVGPLTKSSAGHLYILAATDYFFKWAEAVPLKETNSLKSSTSKERKSSMYNAAANGLAEVFNKTLCNLLKNVVAKSKKDWHERIGEALWAYRTTYRTPTQATPYALVYDVEAVVPLEQQIPSLRIAIQQGLTQEENARLRLEELKALDEKRLEAQQRLECYQARLLREFNKKVRSRSFQVGDLVFAVRRLIITTHRTGNKFTSKWDGSYVVKEVYTNGAYKLIVEDGLKTGPINGKFLKRYYA
ncbi:UNVERIFIED_CONTAM: hypothetical protein Slati_0765400 [Sesamum latifolium]|uniref:Uncharacterized protein n=1 Tax=Sesamum latifolium TaxID=2727402 RepID=A0AAW2XMU8_9LAMI